MRTAVQEQRAAARCEAEMRARAAPLVIFLETFVLACFGCEYFEEFSALVSPCGAWASNSFVELPLAEQIADRVGTTSLSCVRKNSRSANSARFSPRTLPHHSKMLWSMNITLQPFPSVVLHREAMKVMQSIALHLYPLM